MADYPQYEIKIIYDCGLCKEEHTATAQAFGSALAAELAGGALPKGQTIRGRCMDLAKKGIIKDFFAVHPEETVGDFRVDNLRAIETIVHNEDFTDTDKIGVSLTENEVAGIVEELKISEVEKSEVEKAEEVGSLTTGMKKGVDFLGVRDMVERRLEDLKKQEKELITKLEIVQTEKQQFEKLVETAKLAEKIEAVREKVKKEE